MTDKNRDFPKHVGTVVAFDVGSKGVQPREPYKVNWLEGNEFRFTDDDGDRRSIFVHKRWRYWRGYIVSQPEAHDCTTCGHDSDCAVHNGPALPVGPCDCDADQESVRTREEQIRRLASRVFDIQGFTVEQSCGMATAHILAAEQRGAAAGYARWVAEEGG